MTMYPPPPKPLIHGSTTPAAKAVATAASTAFPPRSSMSAPARAARMCLAATTPRYPSANEIPACSPRVELIRMRRFYRNTCPTSSPIAEPKGPSGGEAPEKEIRFPGEGDLGGRSEKSVPCTPRQPCHQSLRRRVAGKPIRHRLRYPIRKGSQDEQRPSVGREDDSRVAVIAEAHARLVSDPGQLGQ